MGLFSTSEKVDKKTILAYNYFLCFDYIPKAIYSWWNDKGLFETALCFESVGMAFPEYKPLIKQTEVKPSNFIDNPDIEMYWVKVPNNLMISEVALACVAINRKNHGFLYFTAEISFGGYAICIPDEEKNHRNTGIVAKDGEEFLKFCIKEVNEKLTDTSFAYF